MSFDLLLGQAEAAATAAAAAMEAATKYGESTYLLIFFSLVAVVLVVLHFYFVSWPNARANRKNQELLTAAITALTPVVAETKQLVENTHTTAEDVRGYVHRIVSNMRIQVEVLKKIARVAKVDINEELGKMAGVLMEDR